jgi:hypothetical protein
MADDVYDPLTEVFNTPLDFAAFGLNRMSVFAGFTGATGNPPQLMSLKIYNWKVREVHTMFRKSTHPNCLPISYCDSWFLYSEADLTIVNLCLISRISD